MFADVALVWERCRLGDKNQLYKIDYATPNEYVSLYNFLFADEGLTERMTLLKVASELNTPIEILKEIMNTNAALLLASESSGSNESTWSIEDILSIRDAFVQGNSKFLPLSKNMSEVEARMFWYSVMGYKQPFSTLFFLRCIGNKKDVPADVVNLSRGFLTDEEIIMAIFQDPSRLHDPKEWYKKPNAALRKRKYKGWSRYKTVGLDEFNGGVYQEIPNKGVCTVTYDEQSMIVVERAGEMVTDVAYVNHPNLGLRERLVKYAEEHDDDIAWPNPIPSWSTLIKSEDTIRFPSTKRFNPVEYNGYVLVKSTHKHNLRISGYQNDEMLHIRLEAVDGLDDFVEVGVCGVYILSERGSVLFELERILGTINEDRTKWIDIPEDICIVVSVSSPFVDRRTGMLSEPVFLSIEQDLGVSDITQYVDLMGVQDE
jgi:hypothetical protein